MLWFRPMTQQPADMPCRSGLAVPHNLYWASIFCICLGMAETIPMRSEDQHAGFLQQHKFHPGYKGLVNNNKQQLLSVSGTT